MFHFDYREPPKGVEITRADLARIARYLLPSWRPSLAILFCILSTSLLGLAPPLIIREIIDRAIPTGDHSLLNMLVAGMIAVPLVSGLIGVWQNWLVTVMGQGVMFDLRNEMYARLSRQSLRFFTNTKSGEILSRLQNDVGGVQGVVTGTLVNLVTNGLIVLTTIVVLFRLDWVLTLVALGLLPLFILPTRRVGRLRSRISKETQERLAELTAFIQESLSVSGFLLMRLFGAAPIERGKFRDKAGAVRDLQIRQNMVGRWFLMVLMFFMSAGPALIYLVGGHEAIARRITIGTIVAFVGYLGRLYAPASALVNVHVEIMSGAALFRRIFEYLDLPVEVAQPAHPVRLDRVRGHLRFEAVSMRYGAGEVPAPAPEASRWTLEDISFDVSPGTMVALVGPSGAGKTTVTYLATRLYDPLRGRVTLDGVDLRELALEDLSRWTAKVTQETTLFHATVEENLRYARPDATREEIERACRLAQVQDVIEELPQGLQTLVGERGYKLSGGEKQRLALARVVLRDPKLLILDEATSSLDSRSEARIREALDTLLAGRSSLVVAHRLSTILRADRILVMDHGRIVETGTHDELLRRGGLYARLYEEQFATGRKASDEALESDRRVPQS